MSLAHPVPKGQEKPTRRKVDDASRINISTAPQNVSTGTLLVCVRCMSTLTEEAYWHKSGACPVCGSKHVARPALGVVGPEIAEQALGRRK